jgi:Flp pilus assembly protein TadD
VTNPVFKLVPAGQPSQMPDLVVPGTGFSIRTIVDAFRSALGWAPTRVSGELTVVADGIAPLTHVDLEGVIRLNESDGVRRTKRFHVQSDMDGVIRVLSQTILEVTEPAVLGEYASSHDDLPAALSYFRQAESVGSLRNRYRSCLASINVSNRLGRSGEADDDFRTAVRLQPRNGSAYAVMANSYIARGEFQAAIYVSQAGVSVDSRCGNCYQIMGSAEIASDKYSDAEAHLRKALRLGSDQPMGLCLLARALLARGALDEARKVVEQCVSAFPGFAMCRSGFGYVLASSGDLDGALAQFRLAAQIDPENPANLDDCARVLLLQGNYSEELAMRKASKALEEKQRDSPTPSVTWLRYPR